jgi:hypothetical protein
LIFAPIVYVSASREISPPFEIAALVEIVPPPSLWLSALIVSVPEDVLVIPEVLIVIVPSAPMVIAPVPDALILVMVMLSSSFISIDPVDVMFAFVTSVSTDTLPFASITKSVAVILFAPPDIAPADINHTSPPEFTDIGADKVIVPPPEAASPVIVEKFVKSSISAMLVPLDDINKSVTPKLAPVSTVIPLGFIRIRSTSEAAVIDLRFRKECHQW